MVTKVCFRCGIEKDISEFHNNKRNKDGHKGTCKKCCRLYVDEHIEEKREYEREHKWKYKSIKNKASKKYRDNNPEKVYQIRHTESYLRKRDMWLKEHKEELEYNQRIYYLNNKDKWKPNPEARRERENKRYREDLDFNIIKRKRSRFYKATHGMFKELTTKKILGCSLDEFKEYFGRLFTEGMSWDLYLAGKIHEDHIIPVDAFNMQNPIEVEACFYYKNYQPLWGGDNYIKNCKYKQEDYLAYMEWYVANVYKK